MKMSEETKQYLKEHGLKEKIQFFWDYYRLPTLGILILLFFIVSMIVTIILNKKPLLYVVLVNSVMEQEDSKEISEAYINDNGIDASKYTIDVDYDYAHVKPSDDATDYDEMAVQSVKKYQVLFLAEEIDVTVSLDWAIDLYEADDWYCNLEETLPEDLYNQVKDKLYYSTNSEGKSIPVGINIKDTKIGNYYETADPILTISVYSNKTDEAINFIRWLYR